MALYSNGFICVYTEAKDGRTSAHNMPHEAMSRLANGQPGDRVDNWQYTINDAGRVELTRLGPPCFRS
jgi:hypothetical protein